MKPYLAVVLLLLMMSQSGCAFLGGAAAGTAATGAAYEYNAKKQMDRLEEDFKQDRIPRDEYLKRKKQIEAGSIIY